MANKKDKLAGQMRQTISEFVTELKTKIFTEPQEQGDLVLVEFFFSKLHDSMMMNEVIQNVLPWENQIKGRKSEFFLNNRNVFKGIPEDRIEYFSSMWKGDNQRLSKDDKDTIWAYFDTMLAIAKAYKKNQ